MILTTERKITRLGNTQGIAIPISWLRAIGLRKGDIATIELNKKGILIKRPKKERAG